MDTLRIESEFEKESFIKAQMIRLEIKWLKNKQQIKNLSIYSPLILGIWIICITEKEPLNPFIFIGIAFSILTLFSLCLRLFTKRKFKQKVYEIALRYDPIKMNCTYNFSDDSIKNQDKEKMIPRFTFLCILIIITASTQSSGQKTDNLIFKFAPLGLLEPYGQNIHLGCEFISAGPFTIETDVATYIKLFNRDETRYKDRIGIKIKPEIRYYLSSKKTKTVNYEGFYIANELYLTMDKFKRGDTFIHFNQPRQGVDSLYYAYEKIRRFIVGDNFKIGYQSVTKINLTFDYYFGLGLRYYNGSYDYKVNDPICCRVMRLFEIPVDKGIKPDLTFGIKIGYVLEK
jgi:hypothetical protein